jgi:hypothetical protein
MTFLIDSDHFIKLTLLYLFLFYDLIIKLVKMLVPYKYRLQNFFLNSLLKRIKFYFKFLNFKPILLGNKNLYIVSYLVLRLILSPRWSTNKIVSTFLKYNILYVVSLLLCLNLSLSYWQFFFYSIKQPTKALKYLPLKKTYGTYTLSKTYLSMFSLINLYLIFLGFSVLGYSKAIQGKIFSSTSFSGITNSLTHWVRLKKIQNT